MKRFEEMSHNEKQEAVVLLGNWLQAYTHEVIVKVLERREEILNNEFTMNLLKELKRREDAEQEEFNSDIEFLLRDYENFKQYDPHNHPTTHAKSYRDILYDMYIR